MQTLIILKLIASLCIIYLFNRLIISRDILFPSQISTIILIVILCVLCTRVNRWNLELSERTFLTIITFSVLFSIGCLWSKKINLIIGHGKRNTAGKEIIISNAVLFLLSLMLFLLSAIYILAAYRNTGLGITYYAMTQIKDSLIENELSNGYKILRSICGSLNAILIFSSIKDGFRKNERYKKRIAICIFGIASYNAILITTVARFSIITELFYVLIIFKVQIKKSGREVKGDTLRLIFKIGIILFGSFIIVGIVAQRFTENTSIYNTIAAYTSSSIYGLNYFLRSFTYDSASFGMYSFNNIYRLLNQYFGLDVNYKQYIVMEFYQGGVTSNIYTGFRQLISDFNFIGAGLFQLLFGFISGKLYKKITDDDTSDTAIIVLSGFAYLYVTIWIDTNPLTYLFSLSTVTELIIRLLLCALLTKRNSKK